MKRLSYAIHLLSDIVVSADSTTLGGHEGLDYIPGSALLGAVVCLALHDVKGKGFDPEMFLSGRLRFLNAYPAINEEATFPMPASFHRMKGHPWENARPVNLIYESVSTLAGQPVQWRGDYMTSTGTVVKVALRGRMRTAIDRISGRSLEGALFGYTSILAGTTLLFQVHAEREEDAHYVDSLLADQIVWLGRSRSAEYGRARITRAETSPPLSTVSVADSPGLVALYLFSDLALSENGMPSLLPTLEAIGLPGASFLPERSFLRSRRYSPWNSYFNSRTAERHVLCKGSVLAYQVKGGINPAGLQERLSGGIGLYCEEGFGQVLVNPSWMIDPPPLVLAPAAKPECHAKNPDTPLIRHLQARARLRDASASALSTGRHWASSWHKVSRRLQARQLMPPGKTQWANVRQVAIRCQNSPGHLPHALEAYCSGSMRRKFWIDASLGHGDRRTNLLGEILRCIGQHPDEAACLALHHASVEMGRRLAGEASGQSQMEEHR